MELRSPQMGHRSYLKYWLFTLPYTNTYTIYHWLLPEHASLFLPLSAYWSPSGFISLGVARSYFR